MSFSFNFKYQKRIKVETSPETVFSFLKNYETAIPEFFPGISRFEESEPLVYFWQFEPMNYGGKQLVISFKTQFEENPNQIKILPKAQTGNTLLRGEWKIEPELTHCYVIFFFELEFEAPLPSFTKSLVIPLAKQELSKLFDQYAQNIQRHFQ